MWSLVSFFLLFLLVGLSKRSSGAWTKIRDIKTVTFTATTISPYNMRAISYDRPSFLPAGVSRQHIPLLFFHHPRPAMNNPAAAAAASLSQLYLSFFTGNKPQLALNNNFNCKWKALFTILSLQGSIEKLAEETGSHPLPAPRRKKAIV